MHCISVHAVAVLPGATVTRTAGVLHLAVLLQCTKHTPPSCEEGQSYPGQKIPPTYQQVYTSEALAVKSYIIAEK